MPSINVMEIMNSNNIGLTDKHVIFIHLYFCFRIMNCQIAYSNSLLILNAYQLSHLSIPIPYLLAFFLHLIKVSLIIQYNLDYYELFFLCHINSIDLILKTRSMVILRTTIVYFNSLKISYL